ncbi:WLM domain-containing protein [Fadolivirus algeromassiliense]|jgi:hypothetical protein|uniref:WLM domain-containing protein n=1 Tax=Fadolivirus FV1/VV64 TaxID=3070911 RepID=A0A7D3R0M9_9VIRU|nr:WLM domain-containing protein [Fadolivirus algeromassiliense]QKF93821.1 WLM domain-containing protein [Fadolivirus FV1/VV64]
MGIVIFIIIIIFIFSIFAILKLEKHEVKYVKSTIDNKEYLVRDLQDKQQSANNLALLRRNIMTLVDHLYINKDKKYKDFKSDIEQLKTRISDVIINESSEDSSYTSYSVNKGEQIVFCLRSKYTNYLHDINLVMYVALHEMAHVACKEYGHTDLFKKIFAFITKVAIELGLYTKIDFKNDPVEYCGLIISESIV